MEAFWIEAVGLDDVDLNQTGGNHAQADHFQFCYFVGGLCTG